MQTKLNVLKSSDQWELAERSDYASDRLLKLERANQKHLLFNEFLTMTLTRIADVDLLHVGPYRALEVIRFDRLMISDRKHIVRVARQHMIDACQTLGLTSTKK